MQMDIRESPAGVGSLGHPQPPNDVPGPLLHIQGVTGASAQSGTDLLWICSHREPPSATPDGYSTLGMNHSSSEPCVSPSKEGGTSTTLG